MPHNIPKNDVVVAVLEGIEHAHKKYREFSGDDLQFAPEYFVTCCIADALHKMEGQKWILLESNVDLVMKYAGATGAGRPKDTTRKDGRTDIVLCYGNGNPRAIIEVKSPIYSMDAKVIKDIERIRDMIKNTDSTFQFGMLAFYSNATKEIDKPNQERLEDRLDTILLSARNKVVKCKIYMQRTG